jgi:hypothetical protein
MHHASIVGVRRWFTSVQRAHPFVSCRHPAADGRTSILDEARIYGYALGYDTLPSAGYSPMRGEWSGRGAIGEFLRGARSALHLKEVLSAKTPHGTQMSWQGELKQYPAACDQAKTVRYGESALHQDYSAAVPRTSPVKQHASPVRCKSPRDHGVG